MKIQIIPSLTALFVVVLVGRVGDGLFLLDAQAAAALVPVEAPDLNREFEQLDSWEQELRRRERDIEAQAIASDMALSAAKATAADAAAAMAKRGAEKISVRKMAAVYASMPPAKAAMTIASLDDAHAANILAAMPADAAGAILGEMEPDRTQALAAALLSGD